MPISGTVKAALDSYLNRHAGIGGAWLFPAPGDRSKPIDVGRASRRLRAAEKLAGLPKLNWGRWHPYRRLFANERKRLPAHDVAAGGGWNDTEALTRIYQKADSRGVLRVVEASQIEKKRNHFGTSRTRKPQMTKRRRAIKPSGASC